MPPRPHPLATARAADWADRAVGALWRKGITAKPPLDPEYLWQVGSRGFAAQDEPAGRSEAEVADFRLRLERLCAAIDRDDQVRALALQPHQRLARGAIALHQPVGDIGARRQPQVA